MEIKEEYKLSNSFKSRESNNTKPKQPEPEHRLAPIASGKLNVKKNGIFGKLVDALHLGNKDEVKSGIVNDIVIPSIKNALDNVITDTAHVIFGNGRYKKGVTSSFSYSNISKSGIFSSRESSRYDETRNDDRFEYDSIVVATRGQAEDVLMTLCEAIDRYGYARVSDLYDLVGITTNNFTYNKFGWQNLNSATIAPVRGGYAFRLPKAMPID